MRLFRRPLCLALMGLAVLGLTGTGFVFHNQLTKSQPEKAATVSAPTEIRLWFREKSEPALSSITLLRAADSSRIALEKIARTDDPLSIRAAVPTALAAGSYIVQWRTSGDDGHVIRGSFPFTVSK